MHVAYWLIWKSNVSIINQPLLQIYTAPRMPIFVTNLEKQCQYNKSTIVTNLYSTTNAHICHCPKLKRHQMCRFSTRPKPCWESVRRTPLLSWLLCYCHANTVFRVFVSEDVSWQLTVTFTFGSLLVKLKECVTVLIECNSTLQYNISPCHIFILQVFSRTHICFSYTPSCCGYALCILFSVPLAYVI